ncbi:TIGR02391 family protein [Isoptericola sp. BMS4]|uniref:TIGR02391 family protein n=1 Tax=Isoptericola sp. BMS4 TaxID=2527875 RepID=UPI001421DDB5|nr:TIGR02391 family protein [Isoptericola sp. BMS4]
MTEQLTLSFDPNTIEHLGFKMYSRLPNAVAELVANSYDADAAHARVTLDTSGAQSVRVEDDGHGMSREDLAERYLRIGRNRRRDATGFSESGRRRVAGRKGLGKLALFGIGKRITIRTKRAGESTWTVVTMDWDAILGETGGVYHPEAGAERAEDVDEHGTTILVEDLQRKSPVKAKDLAESLAKLFNYGDSTFEITVRGPRTDPILVSRDLRYARIDVEAEWSIPGDLADSSDAPPVRGRIITASKPLPQELRGVTLYAKGRLANDPEYFGVPESSYAFSYITGHIDADYLDDLEEDVIATDRRSVSWESSEAERLRDFLADMLREIAAKRRETRRTTKRARLKTDLGVEVDKWVASIRDERRAQSLSDVLHVLESPDTELSDSDREAIVIGMNEIAPEYADLHWRTLHSSIQSASEEYYKDGHYFHAVLEATKRYVRDVKNAGSISGNDDLSALQRAFGKSFAIDVLPGLDGEISDDSAQNIRTAQRVLSEGIWHGFRSPFAHEEVRALRERGFFTHQDCLDALSLLSHLRRRIDAAGDMGGGPSQESDSD